MISTAKFILLSTLTLILGISTYGYEVPASNLQPFTLTAPKTDAITIAVLDKRDMVVDGSRKPQFIGYLRGGYGNVFGVNLESNQSFAAVLAGKIADAYQKAGVTSKITSTNYSDNETEIINKMKAERTSYSVLIILDKLKMDGNSWSNKYELETIISWKIFDRMGKELVSSNFSNIEPMGNGKKYKTTFPPALKLAMEKMLNAPDFLAAFSSNGKSTSGGNVTHVKQHEDQAIQKDDPDSPIDIITTTKGDEIQCKVVEITETTIKYIKSDEPSGPIRNISKANTFMIKYQNGKKELFK